MRIRLQNKLRQSFVDKILSIILIAAILGAIGALGYVIAIPKVWEKFTEFYVLGLGGEAIGYPRELSVGQEGRVIVGIINREQETASYWVEVMIDGVKNNQVETITLEHDEEWEEIVSFTPDRVGDSQKVEVEFLLYKDNESEPYQNLYLLVNVKE